MAAIAENTGLKIENIESCKRHVFLDEHTLDQFLVWERLEDDIYLSEDIEWLKHEFAERHHELQFGSGYSATHSLAQKRHYGNPRNKSN